MKNAFLIFCLALIFISCGRSRTLDNIVDAMTGATVDTVNGTNSYFDNEKLYTLSKPALVIEGEVYNPGPENFKKLYKRSVVVKESRFPGKGKEDFIGAYRYEGYSLFDILNKRVAKKKNANDFHPLCDMYVVIENDKDEKVVFSWGEIYFSARPHTILLATEVSPIVPGKSKDQWPIPKLCRLVVAHDLYCDRYLDNPVKITVFSATREYKINRDLDPMISNSFTIFSNDSAIAQILSLPDSLTMDEAHTIFYGIGRGYHGNKSVKGARLYDVLLPFFPVNHKNLSRGLYILAGIDGYRAVYSYSEIMARNDQSEVLLLNDPSNKNGGVFKSFPACDFFADRAVKALGEIYYIQE